MEEVSFGEATPSGHTESTSGGVAGVSEASSVLHAPTHTELDEGASEEEEEIEL